MQNFTYIRTRILARLLSVVVIATMVAVPASSILFTPNPAFATVAEPDTCGESHTYTFSRGGPHGGDNDDGPANIDFLHTPSAGHPDSLSVSADAGFAITEVSVSVDDDGNPGFVTIASGPITGVDPDGTTINVAKVTVMKICTDICPLVDGMQTGGPCANDLCIVPQTWNTQTQTCVEPPTCPEGQVGTYPNCSTPEPEACPEGTAGVYPACVPIEPSTCPEGTTGVFPVCTPIQVDVCPADEGTQLEGPCSNEDVCPNDAGIQTNTEECSQPTDACPNDAGIQTSTEECSTEVPTCGENQTLIENQCVTNETPTGGGGGGGGGSSGGNPFATCMNNVDDDSDGLSDMNDPGCSNPFDGSEENAAAISGGASDATTTGEVLGAETAAVCAPHFTKFVMQSYLQQNDPEEVKKLQSFLNTFENAGLPVSGVYGALSIKAVKAFQAKHKADVLEKWPTKETGHFYLSTQWLANKLNCEAQGLTWDVPFPSLKVYAKTK